MTLLQKYDNVNPFRERLGAPCYHIGGPSMRRSTLLFDAKNQPTQRFAEFLQDVGIPGASLAEIDSALQDRFFQKNPDGTPKERWELDPTLLPTQLPQLKAYLSLLGFWDETKPRAKHYSYAAWPGALVTRAVARLEDLSQAWQSGVRWNETVIFGGKRPLHPEKENYEACCKAANVDPHDHATEEKWREFDPETELDMMRWLWWIYILPLAMTEREARFVDAPMKPAAQPGGPPVRPNTEDTIIKWLEGNPRPGGVLLSSGAPYGMAQDEAFAMLLEPRGFTVETFGHASPDLPLESQMREVAGAVNRIRRSRLG